MCGIFFSCSPDNHQEPSQYLSQCVSRRGPTASRAAHRSVRLESTNTLEACQRNSIVYLTVLSSVLSLRGNCIIGQPLEDSQSRPGSLLCWNGEAWKVSDSSVRGHDATLIFDLLLQSTGTSYDNNVNETKSHQELIQRVLSVISSVAGPFAFVFYDARNRWVFYGRDALGRRSLAMCKTIDGTLQICSVCDQAEIQDWAEVEADGIYMLDLSSSNRTDEARNCMGGRGEWLRVLHYPWSKSDTPPVSLYTLVRFSYINYPRRH